MSFLTRYLPLIHYKHLKDFYENSKYLGETCLEYSSPKLEYFNEKINVIINLLK